MNPQDPQGSKQFSLNSFDWVSLKKGALIAALGVLLAVLGQLAGMTYKFGSYDFTPLVYFVLPNVVNLIRKYIANNTVAK